MAAIPETETQLKTLITSGITFYEQVRMHGSVNSVAAVPPSPSIKNVVAMQATLDSSLVGTQINQTTGDILDFRAAIASCMKGAANFLKRQFKEYGKLLASGPNQGETFEAQWPNVYLDYATNSKRVTSRGFVFGSPAAAGANSGSGTFVVLHTDAYGFSIENCTAELKTATCTADATSGGTLAEETFTIASAPRGRDVLEEYGTGLTSPQIKGLSAATSTKYGLTNPSFSTSTPVAPTPAPTDISGWTSSITVNGTNYSVNTGAVTTNYYRAYSGDTTPAALNCKAANWVLSQILTNQGAKFLPGTPYYFHVAVCRRSSATGTVTLAVGGSSVSVDLSTLTNDVWYVLKITGSKAWYKTFGGSSVTFSITGATIATGTVDIDDCVIGPYTPFDGSYFAYVGGSTAAKRLDTYTITDAESGGAVSGNAIMQKWLWRGPGTYLPACPASPTSALSAAAGAAGNVNGTVQYKTTYVDAFGQESGGNTSATAITVANKHVSLTAIPVGDASVVSRKIYRTVASGSTFKLLATISDNVTTVYDDNIADGSLGATIGSGVTFAEPT